MSELHVGATCCGFVARFVVITNAQQIEPMELRDRQHCDAKLILLQTTVFQLWQYEFEPNFQTLYVSIDTIYPANFVEVTDTVV